MRFLMLNWRDPRNPLAGGAERVTQGYLAALAQRGHEIHWFANAFDGCSQTEVIDGIHIHRGGGKGTSWIAARQWYRTQPRFDLVLDQHHGIPWYAPWWCGTNCVAYIHEVLGPIWSAFYPWPLSTIGRAQERWTHWFYRRVPFWTASSETKRILHSHGVREVQIIPYGVHTVALDSLEEKPLTQPLKLAVVSRLAPNKRIDHAIRTVKCLVELDVNAELAIVGAGEEEGNLKGLASELLLRQHVRFTGPLPEREKDDLLRQSHWLLHTSQREGWGLNVIEANAMGTPAAVYPVAGLVESTLHEQTGLVSAKETPESLANRLVESLRRPEDYQRWRVQAWERAKTYHWSQVLPQACDWLEEIARRPEGKKP
jgi:glycosyltransferase involved in cell wall biosynthesis